MDEQIITTTKRVAVKRFLLILGIAIIFSVIYFSTLENFPIKTYIISLAIILPVMIISAVIGYKYQDKIRKNKHKLGYLFLIIGVLMILSNTILLFIEEKVTLYFVNILLGFGFLYMGFKKIKNKPISQISNSNQNI